MTLWRCLLTTSTKHPDMNNKVKSKGLNMRSVFAGGQVKSLLCHTFSLTELLSAVWGTMVSLTLSCVARRPVFYIIISLLSQTCPFLYLAEISPLMGPLCFTITCWYLSDRICIIEFVLTGPVNCLQLHLQHSGPTVAELRSSWVCV